MDALDSDCTGAGPFLRRALLALFLVVLVLLCLMVLRPFLSAILWALILAYVTWPLYSRLQAPLRPFRGTAASLMTLLVVAMAVAPIFWLGVLVQHEIMDVYRSFNAYLSQGPHVLPVWIRELPWVGSGLQQSVDRFSTDPTALDHEFSNALQRWGGRLAMLLGDIGRNLGKVLIATVTLFFFYRDGDSLVLQIRRVGRRFFADRLDRPIRAAGTMTRAVVYGVLVSAVAQGLIAGVGYWIFGLEAPIALGALTGLLSSAPLLGTAFVWMPLGIGTMLAGEMGKGLLLLAWGLVLVHPADNVLRPLLISTVTRVPFLLVMFGVLGGLLAFGLVGIFLGPVLLGVATAIWQGWAAAEEPTSGTS